MSLDRRRFLKLAGAQAGVLAAGAGSVDRLMAQPVRAPAAGGRASEVVVIGAGAFGGWTAFHLRRMGHQVLLVDQYGPGNSKATSGGETRGVRTGYGDRELWSAWASRAIDRWKEFDAEWGQPSGVRLFYTTGDLIMRERWEPFIQQTRDTWGKLGIRHEVLDHDEVAYRFPQIDTDGIELALYEPDAGVVRARRATETVAAAFTRMGGEVRIGRAAPGRKTGRRLDVLDMEPGDPISAQTYVFALGPWFGKMFPALMEPRMRIPIGHVFYYGPRPGDLRYQWPNMPSYNFPGVTGWPSLPSDNRGFRIRTGGRPPEDPDESVRWVDSRYFKAPHRVIAERFPDLIDAPLLETRSCHYEISASRDWFIDRHPEYDNVWFAGGGSAEGFKFGPVVGEFIAQRVTGRDAPELADRFRLPEETFDEAPSG